MRVLEVNVFSLVTFPSKTRTVGTRWQKFDSVPEWKRLSVFSPCEAGLGQTFRRSKGSLLGSGDI